MSRILSLFVLAFTFFGFQNCTPYYESHLAELGSTSDSNSATADLAVDPTLQTQALQILSAKCASCHDTVTSGGVNRILDVGHDILTGLIVVGSPSTSKIITAIQTGGMPVGGTITASEMATLQGWISSMHYTGGTPPPVADPLPAGKVVIADATLHSKAMAVLNTNCAGCHQGVNNGGIDKILDINFLQKNGLIVAGDPTQGRLLGAITDGTMPKGDGARVTAADQTALKNWIASMTIVDQSAAPTPLPTRPALTATFAGVNANIIQPKCVACHGPALAYDVNLNSYNAVKARTGDILSKCQSGEMPRSPYPLVTSLELAALKSWIQAGAPNN